MPPASLRTKRQPPYELARTRKFFPKKPFNAPALAEDTTPAVASLVINLKQLREQGHLPTLGKSSDKEQSPCKLSRSNSTSSIPRTPGKGWYQPPTEYQLQKAQALYSLESASEPEFSLFLDDHQLEDTVGDATGLPPTPGKARPISSQISRFCTKPHPKGFLAKEEQPKKRSFLSPQLERTFKRRPKGKSPTKRRPTQAKKHKPESQLSSQPEMVKVASAEAYIAEVERTFSSKPIVLVAFRHILKGPTSLDRASALKVRQHIAGLFRSHPHLVSGFDVIVPSPPKTIYDK